MHVLAEHGARTQPRERADDRARADRRAVHPGERQDHRAGLDARIADHAVRADAHAVAELHPALEDAVDVDLDVAAAEQLAALVETCRIGQAHAGVEQGLGTAPLQAALERRRAAAASSRPDLRRSRTRAVTTGTRSATAMPTMSVR